MSNIKLKVKSKTTSTIISELNQLAIKSYYDGYLLIKATMVTKRQTLLPKKVLITWTPLYYQYQKYYGREHCGV